MNICFFFLTVLLLTRESPRPKNTAFPLPPPFPSHMISLSLASLEKKKYPQQPQITQIIYNQNPF